MITVKVYKKDRLIKDNFITNIYCDEYKNEGSLKTLRLSMNKELICSFPLKNIIMFHKVNSDFDEYELVLR